MPLGGLAGKVAIVPLGDMAERSVAALVRRLAAEGAAVVLVAGADALDRAGRLAAEVEGRAAVFALEPDHADHADGSDDDDALDSLIEFVAETFSRG